MFSLIPKLQNRHLSTENYQCPSFQSSTITWGKWLKPFLPALTFTFQIHAEGYWRNNLDTCNEAPSMLYEYKTLLGNSVKNYCLTVRVADFLPCMFTAILIPLDCIIMKEIEAVSFLFRPRNFETA